MGDGWGANFEHTEVHFVLRGDILPSLGQFVLVLAKMGRIYAYMQKAGDSWDISPQIFLDFPQNFRLRT